MTTSPENMPPITTADVIAVFETFGNIVTGAEGVNRNRELAALIGSPDSYAAIVTGSMLYVAEHPDIFKRHIVSSDTAMLWVGMLVGVKLGQSQVQGGES